MRLGLSDPQNQERTILVGAGYPTEQGARTLMRNSADEQQFLDALHDYVRCAPFDTNADSFLSYILD